MNDEKYVLGIDIGGTNIRIGAFTENGKSIHFQNENSRAFFVQSNPLEALCKLIDEFLKKLSGTMQGICIGFPGTVSKDKTTVLSCPNLLVFNGINVSEALEPIFHVPIIVEHEVVLLLNNDLHEFQLFDKNCVAAIYIGTGLGNALYIHGRILEGKNGNSGELGHIPMIDNQFQCQCGNKGCIELYASGLALEAIHDKYFSNIDSYDEMMQLHSDSKPIQIFIDHLSIAVATEINILDPDVVVLGGGVINIPHFPYGRFLSCIISHTRKPYPANNLNFIRVPRDPQQGSRGAALYGWNRIVY